MIEWVVSVALVAGAFFTLVGSVGLLRFPDFLSRLHAPTKATTLGLGATLSASLLHFTTGGSVGQPDGPSLHEPLIVLFLFISAPVSAYMLARAALHLSNPGNARDDEVDSG